MTFVAIGASRVKYQNQITQVGKACANKIVPDQTAASQGLFDYIVWQIDYLEG